MNLNDILDNRTNSSESRDSLVWYALGIREIQRAVKRANGMDMVERAALQRVLSYLWGSAIKAAREFSSSIRMLYPEVSLPDAEKLAADLVDKGYTMVWVDSNTQICYASVYPPVAVSTDSPE